MPKHKRVISLLGLSEGTADLFATYCHLLKPQLKDYWILNRSNHDSDVLVIDSSFHGKITHNDKTTITVFDKKSTLKTDGLYLIQPINSAQIIKVLNHISDTTEINTQANGLKRTAFNLKKIFSSFIFKNRKSKKEASTKAPPKIVKQKSAKMAQKLLSLTNPKYEHTFKVVFLGRPGSGKTTAIKSASSTTTLNSEVQATDAVSLLKEQTTIGIDYGEFHTKSHKLCLYGTPGQKRYDYMQNQTVEGANIYIILIDLSTPSPLQELAYNLKIIEQSGNPEGMKVAAFTHHDQKIHNSKELAQSIKENYHSQIFTANIDTRETDQVRAMLSTLAEIKAGLIKKGKGSNKISYT